MKRGQGLPVNLIIIAAIALLVLVILAFLVSKSAKTVDTNAGTGSCVAQGGVCRAFASCAQDEEHLSSFDASCGRQAGVDQWCCKYTFNG